MSIIQAAFQEKKKNHNKNQEYVFIEYRDIDWVEYTHLVLT